MEHQELPWNCPQNSSSYLIHQNSPPVICVCEQQASSSMLQQHSSMCCSTAPPPKRPTNALPSPSRLTCVSPTEVPRIPPSSLQGALERNSRLDITRRAETSSFGRPARARSLGAVVPVDLSGGGGSLGRSCGSGSLGVQEGLRKSDDQMMICRVLACSC